MSLQIRSIVIRTRDLSYPKKVPNSLGTSSADAEDVEEEETNILLKGHTNIRQIREADNQLDHLCSNAAY